MNEEETKKEKKKKTNKIKELVKKKKNETKKKKDEKLVLKLKEKRRKSKVKKDGENDEPKEIKRTKKEISFSLVEVIIIIIITGLLVSVCSAIIVFNNYDKISKTNISSTSSDELSEFIESYNHIIDSYVDEVDKDELVEAAIIGMYSYLTDKYTEYIDSSSNQSLQETLNGEYQGIGIQITLNEDGEIYISKVFENTPAEKAGLEVNDILIKVDDIDLAGETTSTFADYVKNNSKTTFEVTYKRDGKTNTITIEKETIILNQVESKTIEDNIGYIKIETFSSTISSQVENKINSFDDSVDKLIIDLRDNSGGYLNSAYTTSSLFVNKGDVIYQLKDKNGKIEKKKSSSNPVKKYKKIVILTNENTASASEILTAALKENLNAISVGTKTYGKGTVQETQQLESGAMVKYTSAYWLTPKGNSINEVGIEPNYEVEEDYSTDNDEQLEKAIEVIKAD